MFNLWGRGKMSLFPKKVEYPFKLGTTQKYYIHISKYTVRK